MIRVLPVNDPPVAVNDSITMNEGGTLNGPTVLANDWDPEADRLTVQTAPVVLPLHGALTISSNGTYVYKPEAYYYGKDSFTYQVCDNGVPSGCATAQVTITVNHVNHAPVVINSELVVNMKEDEGGRYIPVLSNVTDVDHDKLSFSFTVNPKNGKAELDGSGNIIYTPAAHFNGTDHITYQVCDDGKPVLCATGNITIIVEPVNNIPTLSRQTLTLVMEQNTGPKAVNVLSNVNNVDADSLSVTIISASMHGKVTVSGTKDVLYTPNLDYVGEDVVVYMVCDNGKPSLCSMGQINITVTPVSVSANPPVINNFDRSILQDRILQFTQNDFVSNFVSHNTNTLQTIRIESLPVHGELLLGDVSLRVGQYLTLAEMNRLTYVPAAKFNGNDSFRWMAYDGKEYSVSSATVNITVKPATIFIPEGFSPNGDGINDRFVIQGAESYTVTLRVFNRWGNLVYQSDHYQNEWDGIANVGMLISNQLPGGTYFYTVNFNNGEKTQIGYLTLNR